MRGEGGGGARIDVSSVRGVIIRGISSALEKCVCGHRAGFVVSSIITHYHINTVFTQQNFHHKKTTQFPPSLSDFLSVLCFPC